MKQNKLSVAALITFGGAVASGMATASTVPSDLKDSTPLQINQASTTLVAERWLRVPPMCKDRSFPFVPKENADRTSGKHMQSILASFNLAVETQG